MTALRQLQKTCALLRVPTKVTNVKQDSPKSQKKKSESVRLKKKKKQKKKLAKRRARKPRVEWEVRVCVKVCVNWPKKKKKALKRRDRRSQKVAKERLTYSLVYRE